MQTKQPGLFVTNGLKAEVRDNPGFEFDKRQLDISGISGFFFLYRTFVLDSLGASFVHTFDEKTKKTEADGDALALTYLHIFRVRGLLEQCCCTADTSYQPVS